MMPCRAYPPPPQGFEHRFIVDGWHGIERYYGARTEVMVRWIDACGGLDDLQARRKAYLMQKAGRP